MANTIDFILTTAAFELISKVLNGKTLNFTRMAVGDGFSYDTTAAKDYTALVNEVLSLDITKKETLTASSVRITSAFKNTDAQKEFYYREVGLYAQDPDTGEEVLYAYGNRNDAAELITPSGSSVVTKQLIFIITVGDSANVTFNVNADVYALQSDMLEVQANKADKNLANTGMMTNCLLEVPQRVKYELTSEGVLTIKTGTIVIFPCGTTDRIWKIGDDFLNSSFKVVDIQFKDSKMFYWLKLQTDLSINYDSVKNDLILSINDIGIVAITPVENCTSGPSGPSIALARQFWYDTVSNFVYDIAVDASIPNTQVLSFPIMLINCIDTNNFTINQVFNEMGYIGSTFWVDKGVKGLIPNGRNPDGTLNNIEYTTDKLELATAYQPPGEDIGISQTGLIGNVRNNSQGVYYAIDFESAPIVNSNTYSYLYLKSTNLWYANRGTTNWTIITPFVPIIYIAIDSNLKITSMIKKHPFQAVDYNDYSKKIFDLETRLTALENLSTQEPTE